jgi:ATP synthase protein I
MAETPDQDRLAALDARIKALKGEGASPRSEEHYSQAQHAWRMVTEMVAGLGIGFGIGYGLDAVLGTTPWLMVVFTLLGFAAGVNVMMRTARDLQKTTLEAEAAAKRNEGT